MANEDESNNEKVKKFGAHSVAPESSEDRKIEENKKVTKNVEYSNEKGFKVLVSCAKKKCYDLLYMKYRKIKIINGCNTILRQ